MNDSRCNGNQAQFSRPPSIAAGLSGRFFRQARSLGLFSDWRLALLAAMGRKPSLAGWRARDSQDLGLMLVEMGAYLADVVSFYDALVAGESYLSTATLNNASRRLVALLGYRPRPAVAAQALLAAQADGTRLVTLPPGTAFRSGSFLDASLTPHPPQLFELTRSAILEPRINRLSVATVRRSSISAPFDRLLVEPGSCRLKAGDPLVLSFGGELQCCRVLSIQPAMSKGRGTPPRELRFTAPVSPPAGASYASLRILAPGSSARLWQGREGGDGTGSTSGRTLLLDSLVPLRPGEALLFEMGQGLDARRATAVSVGRRVLCSSLTSQVRDSDDTVERTLVSPDIGISVTSVTLDRALVWSSPDVTRITLYHSLSDAARVLEPGGQVLSQGDELSLPGLTDGPRIPVSRMLLRDAHGEAVQVSGSLDTAARSATLDMNPAWGRSLAAPVQLMGNVLSLSRGETVSGELLGLGDASRPSQTFKLAKKPLTYLSAATSSGLVSSLSLRVGGVLWREVSSFFGCSSSDQVYVVRHDDDGETYVTVGPAARPPSASRIVADYRFGAGAAQPPAASITQLARPIAGLRQVSNPLPAFGGADAESPADLAANAPRSALLLGRAVSLDDLAAATTAVAGVRGVAVSWRWDGAGLRPAALIHYIGDSQLLPLIRARLRELSEPDAAITVERAVPQPATLALQLIIDPRYETADVAARAMEQLYAAGNGMLRPERLGPDGGVYLSRLLEWVMDVEGVTDVRSVSFNGTLFSAAVRTPLAGHYWDFGEPGMSGFGIAINGINA